MSILWETWLSMRAAVEMHRSSVQWRSLLARWNPPTNHFFSASLPSAFPSGSELMQYIWTRTFTVDTVPHTHHGFLHLPNTPLDPNQTTNTFPPNFTVSMPPSLDWEPGHTVHDVPTPPLTHTNTPQKIPIPRASSFILTSFCTVQGICVCVCVCLCAILDTSQPRWNTIQRPTYGHYRQTERIHSVCQQTLISRPVRPMAGFTYV